MSETTSIEREIPPPEVPPRRERREYPFNQMVPGDSLVVDHVGVGAFRNYAWRHKWKVTTKAVNNESIRCWRIS